MRNVGVADPVPALRLEVVLSSLEDGLAFVEECLARYQPDAAVRAKN